MALERAKAAAAMERARLAQEVEQHQLEVSTPVQLAALARRRELLQAQMEVQRLANQVRELEVQAETLKDRALQEPRKEILPVEQVPAIAASLSGLLQGAHLSVYGEGSELVSAVAPVVDLLAARLR